ncbi:MAG TPA: nucleoside monophosphate kinase [Chloroflexota bacterium]|nr:nucleoside monophosphate kinase [Chloroflexota bacterium]
MAKPRGLNVVVLGPPGAGKTTQAGRLAQHERVPLASAGDLLREQVRAGTAVGKTVEPYLTQGKLVPDECIMQLLRQRLASPDVDRGFVLDGFPRTLGEADALDEFLREIQHPLTHVLLLQVPDAMALDRLRGRLVCPDCGSVFHARHDPPVPGAVCSVCRTVIHVTHDGRLQCGACREPISARPDDRPPGHPGAPTGVPLRHGAGARVLSKPGSPAGRRWERH